MREPRCRYAVVEEERSFICRAIGTLPLNRSEVSSRKPSSFRTSISFIDGMTFVVWKNRVEKKSKTAWNLNQRILYRLGFDGEISRRVTAISFCGIGMWYKNGYDETIYKDSSSLDHGVSFNTLSSFLYKKLNYLSIKYVYLIYSSKASKS